jgi:hypothetical protein
MPKKLEARLRRAARRKGYGKKREDAYVYGALRRAGWKPKRERR